jgi:hypothetical protein
LFSLRDSLDYLNDSTFNEKFYKGFAVVPQNNGQASALIGINLRDTNTKLAVYFRERVGGRDSSRVVYLRFNYLYPQSANKSNSASANLITRNYAGSQLQNYLGGTAPDDQVFIQNVPGTFARIRIPGLKGLSNRIVHRAELFMQQLPDPLSSEFTPPQFLYLDAFDSTKTGTSQDTAHRAIPFDLGVNPVNGFYGPYSIFQATNPNEFGMAGKQVGTALEWRFNVSRYVQRIVNGTEPFYELRLSSPSVVKNYVGGFSSNVLGVIFINSLNGVGRVRLGGGTNNPALPNRMRLRIIYSKL